MKVFKFGGASVNSIERIGNLPNIINHFSADNLLIIISAMGKTTNELEKVAESFYANNSSESIKLFESIKQKHIDLAKTILFEQCNSCIEQLNNFFTEAEWLLHDKPVRGYDYYYDQLVSIGELLSTTIVSYFLKENNINTDWIDVRDILKTDNNYREATIDWVKTTAIAKDVFNSLLKNSPETRKIIITQGFIGCTDDNETTTLGREGSDYTAAIFANILDAESVSIWKDVKGVMNADPKVFNDALLINELSFEDVIEMAFYGAQVIHPKTIKPLQNKKIPLLVKCFFDVNINGTIIQDKTAKNLPPIYVVKKNQVLIDLHTQDFSFVGEKPIIELYKIFENLKIKPNLIQTGAINVQICLDENENKINLLAQKASEYFNVNVQKNLTLYTIRNFNEQSINKIFTGKEIVLQQKTLNTIQALCF